jgi:hypothetical protein
MNQQHVMVLEIEHPSGAEGWYCPTCGRRIFRKLPPNSSWAVVEPGDEEAYHSGSKGNVQIGSVQVTQNDEGKDGQLDEHLRPWIDAINRLDLNW